MDLPRSYCGKRVDAARADPAFMLFGKQIKGPLPTKDIKEELSPRGVDERGVSLATSSDEEEDLNASAEATWEVAMSMPTTIKKRLKNSKEEDAIQVGSSVLTSKAHWEAQKISQGDSCTSVEMQWAKQKIVDLKGNRLVPQSFTAEPDLEKQQNINKRMMCPGGGGGKIEAEKHTFTREALKSEGEMQIRKRQAGLWSRCPRCNSSDTKFCYFNNYNVNQPRHFCKHCQRYWTAGGTLRNVPVGAGKRKNKHLLRKEAFFMSPVCASSNMTSLDAPVENTDANLKMKPGSVLDVNVDVPAGRGSIRDIADSQIRFEQSSVLGMLPVNTNLELFVHQRASSPINSSCTEAHSLTPLQSQLHMGILPTRSSPICSKSSRCSCEQCSEMPSKPDPPATSDDDSEARMRYSGGGYSRLSEMAANLADERSQSNDQLGSAAGSSGDISADWQSGANWRSGSSGLSNGGTCLRSGSCEGDPDLSDSGRPECLHVQNGCRQPTADERPLTSHLHGSRHSQTNSSFHHGLPLTPSPPRFTPSSTLNLPSILDHNFWPHFYHTYCLHTSAYSQLKPILTPQGWAFPSVSPNLEAPSPKSAIATPNVHN
ncbi:hypothetical protein L7F22_000606 [Adiantum nelumboides]|nr:hypothetical protein [Adiantum nelumboides]